MKVLALLLFLAVAWRVEALTKDEMRTILCSAPLEYSVRFIDCTLDKSSAFVQKAGDIAYECINEKFETEGKAEAILSLVCQDSVSKNRKVNSCLNRGITELGEGKSEDITSFIDALKACITLSLT
ncbi:venom protein 29-like [Centruroides sculpturatus]|uniref:venom protein 29-like n=1 Tax=Centruroides sculpturatus TaxID=218467 RepID=UPI000C6CDC40|nr:venom protein 29-like [Centruroides sculpturatus]